MSEACTAETVGHPATAHTDRAIPLCNRSATSVPGSRDADSCRILAGIRAYDRVVSESIRDGQHDFDFAFGSWTVALSRLLKPLTGSTEWVEYEGTSICRPVWDGRANVDEFRVRARATGAVIDGLTLRLYDPASAEWSLYWASAANGVLGLPPTVGHFGEDGIGAFYDEEEIEGRKVLVRYLWSDITPGSAHFEQAFSTDGGATWEPNWISTQTRAAA